MMAEHEPLALLSEWLEQARAAGVGEPGAVAFVTVGEGGRPSARTVLLKRLEDDALVFTSALWTRKARELALNPYVSLLFYWPAVGRQVHVCGEAVLAERELAVELFAERDLANRVQTLDLAPGGDDRGDRAAARAPRTPAGRARGAARLPARLGCDSRAPRRRRVLGASARPDARQAPLRARPRTAGRAGASRREGGRSAFDHELRPAALEQCVGGALPADDAARDELGVHGAGGGQLEHVRHRRAGVRAAGSERDPLGVHLQQRQRGLLAEVDRGARADSVGRGRAQREREAVRLGARIDRDRERPEALGRLRERLGAERA